MCDFNQLRRTIKIVHKRKFNFKRSAFLQKIIDKDKWTITDINKMLSGFNIKLIVYIPMIKTTNTTTSQYIGYAKLFAPKVYKKK